MISGAKGWVILITDCFIAASPQPTVQRACLVSPGPYMTGPSRSAKINPGRSVGSRESHTSNPEKRPAKTPCCLATGVCLLRKMSPTPRNQVPRRHAESLNQQKKRKKRKRLPLFLYSDPHNPSVMLIDLHALIPPSSPLWNRCPAPC